MPTPRILIVEDNPTARKLYRVTLESEGYEVAEAADGKSMLDRLAEEPPALILLDLLLPDAHGLSLLDTIRALPAGRKIPVVALSSFRSLLEQVKGFDATLTKPVDRSTLLTTIRSLLPNAARDVKPTGSGRRILVVDDDANQLELMTLRLTDAGFSVTAVTDAASGLASARETPPALILTDVLMPQMDGFELCAAVRKDPLFADVPVVLMSAHFVELGDQELARRVGAAGLALRTSQLGEVLAAVEHALVERATSPLARDFPEADHRTRLARRLEQMAAINATLIQRCAHQAAQLSIVGTIATALARTEPANQVLEDVLGACLDWGGISRGAIFRESPDGAMVPDQSVGFDDAERALLADAVAAHPVGDLRPRLSELIASGKAVALRTLLAPERYEALAVSTSVKAGVFVPILVEGYREAALFLGSGDADLGEEELLAFGRAIGAYVGQALTLWGAFGRLSTTAGANRILFSSLDIDEPLKSFAELVASSVGDACEIELVDDQGVLRHAVTFAHDPERRELVETSRRRHAEAAEGGPSRRVLTSKTPELRAEIDDANRAAGAVDPAHAALLASLGVRSEIVAPLLLKGRALGVLTVSTSRHGRRFGDGDLSLVQELAGSAAVAIENARLYQLAQVANRAKDEFLATVSHELRTPLNAMLGWARLLRSGTLGAAERTKALASIERNAVAQTQVVADILDVSSIIAGKLRLTVSEIALDELVTAALDSLRLSMDAKGIVCQASVDFGTTLVCDPTRMQQVIWNLVSNAVKFTPRGGKITVRASATGAHVELSVEDSGQGIEPSFLPHVFERFQQADGSTTRRHGGLGLGLAIARHIVELHGGTIEAHSDGLGKGALFRFTLPRIRATAPGPSATEEAPPVPDAASVLAGVRMLVVDDDADSRELMDAIFTEAGAKVTLADSSAEALRRLDESPHDVLVSDVGMPGLDGLELVRRVRALVDVERRSIPALAVTAYGGAGPRNATIAAGFQGHVTKPFNPEELTTTVAALARAKGTAKPR